MTHATGQQLGPTDSNAELQVPTRLTEGLTAPQAEAVSSLTGPLMVIAGPGSGKTRVLTHRVGALVATGTYASRIMAVTFTNKAAAEMRERIADLVGEYEASRMWVGTFHAICLRLLRPYAELAGLPPRFLISDEDYSRKLIEAVVMQRDPDLKAKDAKLVGSAISWAKNQGLQPHNLPAYMTADEPELAGDYQAYQERLSSLGMADFDDLLLTTCRLLESESEVLAHYQERFDHILVDEVQDANAVQLRLADLLSARSGNLCVVGDLDQSIYSWRGASPEGMADFESTHPHTKVIVLEENFRSTPEILETASALIARNKSLHRPKLFTSNPPGQPVRVYSAVDEVDEARWIVDQVLHSTHPLEAHAVLVRTNSQTRAIEEQLMRHGVGYRVIGGLRFYDRAEVRDALAWLRIAVNPFDSMSMARAMGAPRRGIGQRSIEQILELSESLGQDPISAIRKSISEGLLPKRLTQPLSQFIEAYDAVVEAGTRGPSEALEAIATTAGLAEAVQGRPAAPGQDRLENLEELVRSAKEFRPMNTVDQNQVILGLDKTMTFVEHSALVSATDNTEGSGVTIITAHAAKGLEFPVVFVAGVETGLFPHSRSITDNDKIAEERRLLFVASSRAQEELSLSYCDYRTTFHGPPGGGPSPFLRDLPASVRRVHSTTFAKTPSSAGGRWNPTASTRTTLPGSRRALLPQTMTTKTTKRGPRLAAAELVEGTRVKHPQFGTGTVEEVEGNQASINFGGTSRKLLLEYAPLERAK
jgi:DNA helicase-2/ATP-dependent DNA helicase PcrA